jgi:Sulfotransferase family
MTNRDGASQLTELFPARSNYVNYLANWAVNSKVIYIETPKVGCTAIKQILQYSELNYDSSKLPDDVHDRRLSPLKSPKNNEAEFLACLASEEYFTFSFVRNPFTRVLSAYLDKIIGRPGVTTPIQQKMGIDPNTYIPTFPEFIDLVYATPASDMNPHWAPQTFLLGFEKVRYDYLGRFEFFRPSIDHLVSRTSLQVPAGALSHGKEHATDASVKAGDYYTKAIIEQVLEIYCDDFRYLGYGWSI